MRISAGGLLRGVGRGAIAGARVGIPVLGIAGSIYSAKDRIKRGEHPAVAWLKEGGYMAMWAVIPTAPAILLMSAYAVPAITQAAISGWNSRSSFLRTTATPFSKRFEHTDASAEQLRRGMQAISASRGNIGMEAFNMHKRYGR